MSIFIDTYICIAMERNHDINGVAATAGPGLIGGLLVGLSFAKTIAQVKKIPFTAVNHLSGHALTARLTNGTEFPYLLLLISGGHSCFYYMKKTIIPSSAT